MTDSAVYVRDALGHAAAERLVKRLVAKGRMLREIVLEEGLLDEEVDRVRPRTLLGATGA